VPPAEPVRVTRELLRGWPVPEPGTDGDKHSRGTVLVVGGAASTPGAVLLAGLAALRVGAGRLRIATVEPTAAIVAVAIPEARVDALTVGASGSVAATAAEKIAGLAERADAVVLGPGLLDRDATRELLAQLLPALPDVAVVLDAVALSAIGGAPELARPVRGHAVFTPNGGECGDLLGDDDRPEIDAAQEIAVRFDAAVAVTGAVAAPDGQLWRHDAGDVGLGTSGSGDVLAGAVGGLLARGCAPAHAAVVGQYLHATAGDRLAARLGRVGFLAREVLDELPLVLSEITRGNVQRSG
jgi:ADP-dependent NAD(P)H-hydrate dehydratase